MDDALPRTKRLGARRCAFIEYSIINPSDTQNQRLEVRLKIRACKLMELCAQARSDDSVLFAAATLVAGFAVSLGLIIEYSMDELQEASFAAMRNFHVSS